MHQERILSRRAELDRRLVVGHRRVDHLREEGGHRSRVVAEVAQKKRRKARSHHLGRALLRSDRIPDQLRDQPERGAGIEGVRARGPSAG